MDALNLNTIMDEPRQIIMTIEGSYLPSLHSKPKEITINLPNPSFRQAQRLRAQYYQLVNAYITKDADQIVKVSTQIVIEALKPSLKRISRKWILKHMDEATFIKVLDFILAPTREREEEALKNVMALQDQK